ncbi:MAG: sulfurase, partial [Aeromicrobium sp.]|nr:sulfurase [Aeromicrobium sp.]
TPERGGALVLSAEGRAALDVAVPVDGVQIPVDVKRLPTAVDAGDPAAEWFSSLLGEPVRLVWQDDPARRPISESHGGLGGEPLSLADTGPLLLTSTASLAQLNDWIAADHEPQPMVMGRFRPNVVVGGDLAPFAEDDWRNLEIGGVPYRFAEHCDRCVVTPIDPRTLQHSKEPIRTLAGHRKWDGKTWFGIRIIPVTTGTLSVGDAVTIG